MKIDDINPSSWAECSVEPLAITLSIGEVMPGVHDQDSIDTLGGEERIIGRREASVHIAEAARDDLFLEPTDCAGADINTPDLTCFSDCSGEMTEKITCADSKIDDAHPRLKLHRCDDERWMLPVVTRRVIKDRCPALWIIEVVAQRRESCVRSFMPLGTMQVLMPLMRLVAFMRPSMSISLSK